MADWIWTIRGYYTPKAEIISAQREPWLFMIKQVGKRKF